jgi:hypothetical protein
VTYPGVGTRPTLPTETLTGRPLVNGKLGPCDLTPVYLPGVGTGSLHPYTKRAWDALVLICKLETGATLTATSVADTYRSYAQQEWVFRQRMLPHYDPIRCTTTTRTWEGKTWWLRRGMAPVASPGKSNHGVGIAVDVAIWAGSKITSLGGNKIVFGWMLREAGSFGFNWELASESWHVRHHVGDTVTQRVKDIEKFLAGAA